MGMQTRLTGHSCCHVSEVCQLQQASLPPLRAPMRLARRRWLEGYGVPRVSDWPVDFCFLLILEMEVSSRDVIRFRFTFLVETFPGAAECVPLHHGRRHTASGRPTVNDAATHT